MGIFAFMLLWRLFSFHLVGQKERKTVFILHHRMRQSPRFFLICPSLCENGCEGLLSITWLKPHQTPMGQILCLCSAVLPQVCPNRKSSQPKLSDWAGNSKDGESWQAISCQNLKHNNLLDLVVAPTEICSGPDCLQYCVSLCIVYVCVCISTHNLRLCLSSRVGYVHE